jgi:hypothetical protein
MNSRRRVSDMGVSPRAVGLLHLQPATERPASPADGPESFSIEVLSAAARARADVRVESKAERLAVSIFVPDHRPRADIAVAVREHFVAASAQLRHGDAYRRGSKRNA